MIDFSSIFSSRARYLVLRTLFFQQNFIPLRHVAYLSALPVFSIQCALKQLLKDKLIKRAQHARFVLFNINPTHVCYEFLAKVFSFETEFNLKKRSFVYHDKAQAVLAFSDTARDLFKMAIKKEKSPS